MSCERRRLFAPRLRLAPASVPAGRRTSTAAVATPAAVSTPTATAAARYRRTAAALIGRRPATAIGAAPVGRCRAVRRGTAAI